jgi:uncharacterized membrane protein YkvA (DUF1232 family)
MSKDVALMTGKAKDFFDVFNTAQNQVVLRANERRVKSGFLRKLLRLVGRIPFAHDAAAAYFCALDPKTNPRVRAILLAALAYFVLPVDAIPDLFAAIGLTDDASVLAIALGMVSGAIQPRHRDQASRLLRRDEPA